MKSSCTKRLLCILMSLCLALPAFALAEGTEPVSPGLLPEASSQEAAVPASAEEESPTEPEQPTIPEVVPDPNVDYAALWPKMPDEALRTRYDLRVSLDPNAFPQEGTIHYADWASFLNKLSMSGDLDIHWFPYPELRYNHTGWLNLNGSPVLSLNVDAYAQERFISSNACMDDSILFHMDNFLEFMTKPTYFGIEMKALSLLMYPDAAMHLVMTYEDCFAPFFTGDGTRHISYDQLAQLALQLNSLAPGDSHANRLYRFLNNLLDELRISVTAYENLGRMDEYLAFLDPDKKGMLITATENSETFQLGQYTLLTRQWTEDSSTFTLTLPDQEGNTLILTWAEQPGAVSGRDMTAHLTVVNADGETTMELLFEAKGLPAEEQTLAEGTVCLALGGDYLEENQSYNFNFRMERSEAQTEGFTDHWDILIGWLVEETGLPGLTFSLSADTAAISPDDMKPIRTNKNQPDFFRLNESVIKEYVSLYGKSAVLCLVPIALEVPAGIINDIYAFIEEHDILPTLGIW